MQGCHWFWSAREIELQGSTEGQPRRRRGGDRWGVLGGAAREGSSSARGQWVQGSRGVTRGAAAKLELACGRPREAAGGADCRRGVKQRSRLEVEERIILQFLKIPGTSL